MSEASFLFLGLAPSINSKEINGSAREVGLRRGEHSSRAGLWVRNRTHVLSFSPHTDPTRQASREWQVRWAKRLSPVSKLRGGLAGWASVLGLSDSQGRLRVRIGFREYATMPNIQLLSGLLLVKLIHDDRQKMSLLSPL